MNIHEHQAKKILKEYGAVVPEGIFAFTVDELIEKAKKEFMHSIDAVKALWEAASKIDPDLSK